MPASATVVRTRDRTRTRAALIAAAAEVFTRRGVDGASLDEIAEVAGYTRGAVHNHFSSKHELFLAVVAQRNTELLAAYDSVSMMGSLEDIAAGVRRWKQLHADDRQIASLRLELRSHALRSDDLRRAVIEVDAAAVNNTAAALQASVDRDGQQTRYPLEHIAELMHLVSQALVERAILTGEDSAPLMQTFLSIVHDAAFETDNH